MKTKLTLIIFALLLTSCGGSDSSSSISSSSALKETATINLNCNYENVIQTEFEKNDYYVGDEIKFNIRFDDTYTLNNVKVNNVELNENKNTDYSYSFVAVKQNNISVTLEKGDIYTDPQPIIHFSFDEKDANGRYYDEISGDAAYQIGDIEEVDANEGKAAHFNGESSLSLDSDFLPKKNSPHTIMATVHIDEDDINSGSENVIAGWGEYRHLSDTRLMIYHGRLCITSFDVCNFCDIPQEMKDGFVNLTMVYDGKYYLLYIDGTYEMTATAQNGINMAESPLYIGGFGANILNYKGDIDSVYVFDKALEEEEIMTYVDNKAIVKKASPNNNEPTRNGVEIFNVNSSEFTEGSWNEFQYVLGNTILPIQIYIPSDYDGNTKFRFLTFLHGDGSNGQSVESIINGGEAITVQRTISEYEDTIILVASAGAPWLGVPNDSSPESTKYPYKNYDMYNEGNPSNYLLALDQLMWDMQNNLPIKEDEVYVSGYSRGSMGVWWLLATYPNRFASAICCCGQGDPLLANTLRETPLWVFHGSIDNLVDLQGIRNVVNAVEAENGDIRLTVYNGAGHSMTNQLQRETDLLNWLYSYTNHKLDKHYTNGSISDWNIDSGSYKTINQGRKLLMIRDLFLKSGTVEFDMKLSSNDNDGGVIVSGNRQTISGDDNKEHSLILGRFNNKIGLFKLDGATITEIPNAELSGVNATNDFVHFTFTKDTINKKVKL